MKKIKTILLVLMVALMFVPTTTAQAGKAGFYFELKIASNDGRRFSASEVKNDSAGYGAVTTNYNDLIWSDKVYYNIHRINWYGGRVEATGYHQVSGNGTVNMWYNSGQAIQNSNYQLEGDTDVYDAIVSGIWEP